jgi:hypothetical protein
MTPEGHMFAAWNTFSAQRRDGVTIPRIEVLLRANDPFYEFSMPIFGHRHENAFWRETLRNLAARFGVESEVTLEQTCVDRRRQWRNIGNVKHNAALRTGIFRVTHPRYWFRSPADR